jgi:hypothetical protein
MNLDEILKTEISRENLDDLLRTRVDLKLVSHGKQRETP